MTIKENITLINEMLTSSYTNLQHLVYEEEIEKFVRVKLLEITHTVRDILEFTHSQEVKQRQGKSQLKRLKKG